MFGLAHFEMSKGMVGWLSLVQNFESRDVNGSGMAGVSVKFGGSQADSSGKL